MRIMCNMRSWRAHTSWLIRTQLTSSITNSSSNATVYHCATIRHIFMLLPTLRTIQCRRARRRQLTEFSNHPGGCNSSLSAAAETLDNQLPANSAGLILDYLEWLRHSCENLQKTQDQNSELENSCFLISPSPLPCPTAARASQLHSTLQRLPQRTCSRRASSTGRRHRLCSSLQQTDNEAWFVADCNWHPPLQQQHFAKIGAKVHFIADIKRHSHDPACKSNDEHKGTNTDSKTMEKWGRGAQLQSSCEFTLSAFVQL